MLVEIHTQLQAKQYESVLNLNPSCSKLESAAGTDLHEAVRIRSGHEPTLKLKICVCKTEWKTSVFSSSLCTGAWHVTVFARAHTKTFSSAGCTQHVLKLKICAGKIEWQNDYFDMIMHWSLKCFRLVESTHTHNYILQRWHSIAEAQNLCWLNWIKKPITIMHWSSKCFRFVESTHNYILLRWLHTAWPKLKICGGKTELKSL